MDPDSNKLQHMADLVASLDIPMPQQGRVELHYDPEYDTAAIRLFRCSRDELVRLVRALPGRVSKGGYGNTYWVEGLVEDVLITGFARNREEVCRKIVIGTKQVEESKSRRFPAHEEEIVEWECEPLLAEALGAEDAELATR